MLVLPENQCRLRRSKASSESTELSEETPKEFLRGLFIKRIIFISGFHC